MSTTLDYEDFLTESETSLDKVCHTDYSNFGAKSLSEYSSNCRILDGFADTAFRVGNSNAFSAIIDEFLASVNIIKQQASNYLSEAEKCATVINTHMSKDNDALRTASNAYTEVLQEIDMGTEFQKGTGEYITNGNVGLVKIMAHDFKLRTELAEKRKQEAWRENNCDDLWKDLYIDIDLV